VIKSLCYGEICLWAVARQVPKLEWLRLAGSPPRSSLLCVMEYRELRTLDLLQVDINDGGDRHIFRDLIAALSSLKQLIKLLLPHVGLVEEDMPRDKGFERLHSLTVAGPPKALITFLDALSTHTLRDVTLGHGTRNHLLFDVAGWQDCVTRLCALHGPSLRTIDLRLTILTRDIGLCRMGIVIPILELHHLEVFAMYSLGARLSVNDVQTMASAWPHLQILRLGLDIIADEKAPYNPRLSAFHCLIPLARLCCKLTTLEIRMIGRILPDLASWPTIHHGLVNLDLDVPNVVEADPVIHILHNIFPVLDEVTALGASDDYDYDK